MLRTLTAIVTGAMMLATPAGAQPELVAPERPAALVEGPLKPLDYFIGDWEIDATWGFGGSLRARNEYRVGLGGRFLEVRTIASDNNGPAYERYQSFYTYDAANEQHVAVGMTYDGTTSSLEHTLEVENGLPRIAIDNTTPDGTRLRQRLDALDQDRVAWKVWMTPPGAEREMQIMDGVWHRVIPDDPEPGAHQHNNPGAHEQEGHDMTGVIDTTLFDAGGPGVRSFTKTATIDADVHTVFGAWSTPEGWRSVYDRPESAANIELEIGGRYEWLFDGQLGSNGCQVLCFIPDRMIAFSWNAPPAQPESRDKRTWVVVETEPDKLGRTRVTLTHLGFGEASHWDETYAYFDAAWDRVLAQMESKLGAG